jgi:Domain of unknown function (DUF1830)
MPYLLSLLSDQLTDTVNKVDQGLCYYINKSNYVQTIRATNQGICYLECLVFPGERVIFATLADSYLEITSDGLQGDKIECELLYI